MRFDVDLVSRHSSARRDAVLVAVGLAVFGVGLAAWSIYDARRSGFAEELARNRNALSQLQAQQAKPDGVDPQAVRDELMRQYRSTFPWNDVLSAVEAISGMQVEAIVTNVDAGTVRLDLSARDETHIARTVAGLTAALNGWNAHVVRQSRHDDRVVVTIDLVDPQKPKAPR